MLHQFSCAKELIKVANNLGIENRLVVGDEAKRYITYTINKFKPIKVTGHLSIGSENRLDTDSYEYSFSLSLRNKAYIFFEQNFINMNNIVVVDNAKKISEIIKNSFGMEYFVSDENSSYLISVNWYSIEWIGNVHLEPSLLG